MSEQYNGLSRSLAWLLRHGALENGLDVSPDGYILLDDIFKLQKFKKYKFDNIKYVVDNNDKQRFALKEENNKWYIRANQGHSHNVASKINQEELLTKLDDPLDCIIHGTTYSAYNEIKNSGLKKLSRSHIHFAITDDFVAGNQQQSGLRSNCQILIYLDMEKAMNDGIEFYMSSNKVVLSQGVGEEGIIDAKYFSKVIDKVTRQNIQDIQ